MITFVCKGEMAEFSWHLYKVVCVCVCVCVLRDKLGQVPIIIITFSSHKHCE